MREQLAGAALSKDLQAAFRTRAGFNEASHGCDSRSLWNVWTRLWWTPPTTQNRRCCTSWRVLQARAARAELLQSEILDRKAAFLSNALYPNKVLQEREIAGVYFLARTDRIYCAAFTIPSTLTVSTIS